MIEYEVGIEERPLGVRFAHADRGETVVVHLVLENKVGHKLGLLPGDILIAINGQSVLDISSSEALDRFRGQQLPFKASFRRFEDDDDFGSDDEENSDTDLQSHFQQEDANSIMHLVSTQQERQSVASAEWSSEQVCQWLLQFGARQFNDEKRFEKYKDIFADIDGKALRQLSKARLTEIGVADEDVVDLYRGIQQLHSVVFAPPKMSKKGVNGQLEDAKEAEQEQDEDDEEDNWEAPFLPYMYDAPQITLSANSKCSVYSARVVSPYKKKGFALYELEVAEGKDEWLLSKRYSEFYKLYEAMKKLGVKTKIHFPKKGIFYKSTDKQVMEDRKLQLTEYINELLKHHPKARDSKVLSDFLSPSRTFVVDE